MRKISVSLSGHQTSISLEPEFISALHEIAARDGKSVAQIIAALDETRTGSENLSSRVRVWILKQYKTEN